MVTDPRDIPLSDEIPDDDPVSDPQTFTMPEPPDGTRLEFDWHTDRYAAWRDDTSSTEAGWPDGYTLEWESITAHPGSLAGEAICDRRLAIFTPAEQVDTEGAEK